MAHPAVVVPVRRSWLPGGDAGVYVTLAAMREAARAVPTHPIVQQAVLDATQGATDPVAVWRGIRQWLGTRVRFRPDRLDPLAQQDPDLVEIVHTPLDQLRTIARQGIALGDCDDVATLAAALTLGAQQRARFVVAGFRGPGAPYRHVYAELLAPGGALDYDITRTARAPLPTRIATVEV